MLNRRTAFGLIAFGAPVVGAFGYAAQTGRIDLLTPTLPEQGELPPIAGVLSSETPTPGLSREAFSGGVTLLNVWASWCPNCRMEHAELMTLAKRPGIRLFGLATDDTERNVSDYLFEAGNPFQRLSLDTARVYQRTLKHRGIPQTYVFRADGTYANKITGELTPQLVETQLMPMIGKASLPA